MRSVNIPVIASGDITTLSDIATVREAGAKGAVIGSALYHGRFKLAEAIGSDPEFGVTSGAGVVFG